MRGRCGARGASRDYPTVDVVFNSNNTISATLNGSPLGTSSGAPTTIPPGTYNLSFTNPTYVSNMQFHLEGPRVKLVTNMSYGEEPSEIWVETFAPVSTYTWKDDLDPTPVFTFVTSNTAAVGSANSGSAGTSSGKSSTPISSGKGGKASSTDVVGSAILPLRGTLLGTVTAAGTLSLRLGGKPVQNLKAGRYELTVTDASRKAGFNLQQIKSSAIAFTTTTFTGKRTKSVTLRAGQWFFYPTFVPGMLHGRLVRPLGQGAYGDGTLDLLGVVATNEYDAIQAAASLEVSWLPAPARMAGSGSLFAQMRALDVAGAAPARTELLQATPARRSQLPRTPSPGATPSTTRHTRQSARAAPSPT